MLIVGGFLQNYILNGTSFEQASGILGYDPSSDSFTRNFGGVKNTGDVQLNVMQETPWSVIYKYYVLNIFLT